MNRLIRRHSMEHLELYDLDQFEINQPPPPPPRLPPPRKPLVRRSSMNPSLERYQFLCNMTRTKTDPIYAATPMFTTIPETSQEKPHRQLLGSYVRLENVKPVSSIISKSPEPKKVEIIEDVKEDNGKENEGTDDVDNDYDELSNSSSSSSSSDEEKNAGGGGNDDDKDDKGIVEQILNRDKNT